MRMLKLVVIAMFAMLLLAQGVWAEMTTTMSIAGDVETNTTAEFLKEEGDDDDKDSSNMTNDGRVKVTVTGRTEGENGWYGAAVAQPLVSTDVPRMLMMRMSSSARHLLPFELAVMKVKAVFQRANVYRCRSWRAGGVAKPLRPWSF